MSSSPLRLPSSIVAIPACDEAERIGACLSALAMQRTAAGAPLAAGAFEVLVLANNCRDETAEVARGFVERLPFALHVVERRLPRDLSHAGGARRVALDLAADRLAPMPGGQGVLLTTDADSRVGPTWIAANLAALAAGVDAVAGYVDADPAEYLALGRGFLERGRLEDRFLALVARLHGRLDPRPHDPWPHHRVHSGASFALTLAAYRAIGGLPPQPLGEDTALAVALENDGFLIRHSLEAVVTTSCRFDSRARGGAGDTMKLRHAALDAPCDADFEPAAWLFRRVRMKGELRRLHASGRLGDGARLARVLGIDLPKAVALLREGTDEPFARLWARVEAASPFLRRPLPLRPSDLPAEIAKLERLLRRLDAPRRGERLVHAARAGLQPIIAEAASPV